MVCRLRALIALTFLAAALTAPSGAAARTTYQLWFLGGQSNMEGFGVNAELPAAQKGVVPGVYIFDGRMVADREPDGGVGVWSPLQPGFGTGFATDGATNRLSDRFGPELPFGRRLSALSGGAPIAIIKYARGGSMLFPQATGFGTWDPDESAAPGPNQYDNALAAIRNATAVGDIDGDGVADRLVPAGVIWMQGEADAYDDPRAAAAYQANLRRMMDLLRAALRVDDLPVVIGRIQDSGTTMAFDAEVQAAQKAWVAADACAALVDVTRDFAFLPDRWHYVSADYLRLGDAFADAAWALQARCPSAAAVKAAPAATR